MFAVTNLPQRFMLASRYGIVLIRIAGMVH
jgi:hypothetical protein